MKWIRIALLGIGLWSPSLLWPGVYEVLNFQVMVGLWLGLGLGMLMIYTGIHHLSQPPNRSGLRTGAARRPESDYPTCPTPVIVPR